MAESEDSSMRFLGPIIFLFLLYQIGLPLWGVAILAAWYMLLIYLENSGKLDDWDATRVLGFILMLRTRQGQKILDRISKYRRFWRAYGEFSIWLCFTMMAGVILLLVLTAILASLSPPENALPARDLLLIPGVTSFVPFWWPVLALIFALVIHEYSHGIQARAHGMRIRSFGLLLAGPLPMGAFAEPELQEMTRAPRRERIRLYAAGPSINIVATYLILLLLSAAATGFVAADPGVHARAIVEDSGAEDAGLLPYEIITHIDGVATPDTNSFAEILDARVAGDEVTLTILGHKDENGERVSRDSLVTLTDQYEYYIDLCEGDADCIAETEKSLEALGIEEGNAFLGVSWLSSGTAAVDMYEISRLSELGIVGKTLSFGLQPLAMMGVPVAYEGQTMSLQERDLVEAGDGVIASALGTEGLLALFDFLFWLAWINFILGFANLIPMVPFDGGHIVHDTIHSIIARLKRDMHPLKVEMLANRFSNYSSIGMLVIVLFPIILPRII